MVSRELERVCIILHKFTLGAENEHDALEGRGRPSDLS